MHNSILSDMSGIHPFYGMEGIPAVDIDSPNFT